MKNKRKGLCRNEVFDATPFCVSESPGCKAHRKRGQAFRVVIDLVRIPMVMPQIGADDTSFFLFPDE